MTAASEMLAELRRLRTRHQFQVTALDVLGLALSRDLLTAEQVGDWLDRFDIGTSYRAEYARILSEWRGNDAKRSNVRRAA